VGKSNDINKKTLLALLMNSFNAKIAYIAKPRHVYSKRALQKPQQMLITQNNTTAPLFAKKARRSMLYMAVYI